MGNKMCEYAERDIINQGEHYTRHVKAMTAGALFGKSDIAAELAHRDIQIESLEQYKAKAHALIDDLLASGCLGREEEKAALTFLTEGEYNDEIRIKREA